MALLRPLLRLLLPLLAASAVGGCAFGLNWDECDGAGDVGNMQCRQKAPDGGGAQLFCTKDRKCVEGLPEDQLCVDSVGQPVAGALVFAVLTNRARDATEEKKPLSITDYAAEQAAKLAIEEINMRQAGGSQPPILAWLCDSGDSQAQALKAAQYAVNQKKAVAIIGPTGSDAVLAINSLLISSGTLAISPSATSTEISSLADNGLVWRTAPSDALQAKLLAEQVNTSAAASMQPARVATLYVNTIYGKGLNLAFVTEYNKLGGRGFTNTQISFEQGGDTTAALNALAKQTPTHALIVADVDVADIVGRINGQPNLAQTLFFMTDAARTPDLFGQRGTRDPSLLKRIRLTTPATRQTAAYKNFRSGYTAKPPRFAENPDPIAFVANAYDATYLLAVAAAATQGRVPGGKDLATGLGRLRPMGPAVSVGPTDYLTALKQMSMGGVRLDGASGPLDFDAQGDLIASPGQFDTLCINANGPMPSFASVCPTRLVVEPGDVMLKPGEKMQLKATATLPDSTTVVVTDKVIWSSADPSVATVDAKGSLRGEKAGSTKITAKVDDVAGDANVTVTP